MRINAGYGDAMTRKFRTVAVIKGQMAKFSGIIVKGLSKPKQRLVKKMMYGIQAAKDIKVSSIVRALKEPIPFMKIEHRLYHNLDDEDFTAKINNQIWRLGSPKVMDDMVIAIDPGDIRKRYAIKMEHLSKVHDEVGEGYWLCKSVAADIEHKKVIPIYLEDYPQEAKDFRGENAQIFKAIDTMSLHIVNNNMYAIDRGGDRRKLYDKFLEKGKEKRFVIRLGKTRDLIHKGHTEELSRSGHSTSLSP
jgi:hypothetical protein